MAHYATIIAEETSKLLFPFGQVGLVPYETNLYEVYEGNEVAFMDQVSEKEILKIPDIQ